MDVFLRRVLQTSKGTFGALIEGIYPLCVTLEDPWNYNERNISCIPAGTYECVKHAGTKYKDVWILKDVPERSAILIHVGNTIDDTQGCILVGHRYNRWGDKPVISESGAALRELRKVLPDEFTLTIEDRFNN